MKEVSMISSADNDINEFILSTGDFNFLWFPFLSNFKIFVNLHDVGVCLKLKWYFHIKMVLSLKSITRI
jgi:hypothetical protein